MLSEFHESFESYNERDSLKTMNEDKENEYKEKEDNESNESKEEEEIILYCTKNEEWDVYFLKRRVENFQIKFIKTLENAIFKHELSLINFLFIWDLKWWAFK